MPLFGSLPRSALLLRSSTAARLPACWHQPARRLQLRPRLHPLCFEHLLCFEHPREGTPMLSVRLPHRLPHPASFHRAALPWRHRTLALHPLPCTPALAAATPSGTTSSNPANSASPHATTAICGCSMATPSLQLNGPTKPVSRVVARASADRALPCPALPACARPLCTLWLRWGLTRFPGVAPKPQGRST